MRRRGARMIGVAAPLLSALVFAIPTAGAASPQRTLAETYSPTVMLREQDDPPCDSDREQYEPTTVDAVLGNPDVRLISPSGAGEKPIDGPTAADVAGLGSGYYLDLPGNPLNAGCTYGRDFAELVADGVAPPITYAHIRRVPDDGKLVVQYWFFYYFNQFNDLHESDWEGMQIIFDAASASEALANGPSAIGLFQHGGGEQADWTDSKVEKQGTHPVVYPAAGSHATFYESAIYIENGKRGSGVGCDNSSEPLRQVTPAAVLVPTHPKPGSEFQWLTFEGRWGQKESGFNNGPTGPNTKPQWLDPMASQDSFRHSSPVLPGDAIVGPTITSAFCGTIAQVSSWINLAAETRTGAILLGLGLLVVIIFPFTLTRWRPVELDPLRQARRLGQLLRAARQLYGRHWKTMVPIGLSAIALILGLDAIYWVVRAVIDAGLDQVVGAGSGRFALEGSVISTASIGAAVASGAVIVFLRELERDDRLSALSAYRQLWPPFWRMLGAQMLVVIITLVLALTLVGIPIAIWKYVEWQFVQQGILFENRGIRDSLRSSTRLVRGHWWYTVRVAGFLWLISIVAGPALGVALVFTDLPLWGINLLGSIVFALLIPYVAIGRTLLYFDLKAAESEATELAIEEPRPDLGERADGDLGLNPSA